MTCNSWTLWRRWGLAHGVVHILLVLVALPAQRQAHGADETRSPNVEAAGPACMFMPDLNRYAEYRTSPPERLCPIPTLPVTRETYFKWLEFSRHFAYANDADTHGIYGPRHYLPVLAKYVQSGDDKYGRACLRMIEQFDAALRADAREDGRHEIYGSECAYLGIYRRYLVAGKLMSADDPIFRGAVLNLARTLRPWNGLSFFRGPMHRAQGEGVVRGLVARWYPEISEAAEWSAYADAVYQDWWRFRDFPQNDTGYLFASLMPLFLRAWITGDDAFFTDQELRPLWQRLVHEVSPDGSVPPYGAHGGWNSTAGPRIAMLEMLAAKTRDGTYRFVAHRLMNYLIYQRSRYRDDHMLLGPESTEPLALAYLFADDSVTPVPPPDGSLVLTRKETLRFQGSDKEGPSRILGPLDPRPDRQFVDCGLVVSETTKPSKLVLRSGWNPGDLFVLVDLFPRHDPVNALGILGMTRWGAALAGTISAKESSDENRVSISRTDDGAPREPRPPPEAEVICFEDSPLATVATVRVTNFDGAEVTCLRHFLFVKNHMLLVRDELCAENPQSIKAASVFNTQNIAHTSANAAVTYVSQPLASRTGLLNPPVDLLVYHCPQPGMRLTSMDRMVVDRRTAAWPAQLRYEWAGTLDPETPVHFTTLYRPQPPRDAPSQANSSRAVAGAGHLGLSTEDISVVLDGRSASVLRVTMSPTKSLWLVLNPNSTLVDVPALSTRARAAVVVSDTAGESSRWSSDNATVSFRENGDKP